jgi:hypothetical protein
MKNSHLLTAVLANVIVWMALPVQADEAAAIAALRDAGFKVKQAAGTTELGFGQPEWTADLWQRLLEITSLTTLRGTAKCADNAGFDDATRHREMRGQRGIGSAGEASATRNPVPQRQHLR